MKTLVILGARGYIGSNLTRKLQKTYRLKVFKGNIRKREELEKIIVKGDVVINLVGTTTIPQDEKNHLDVNVMGQQVVASVCAKKGARVIYLSTVHVYTSGKSLSRESDEVCPEDVYSFSKKLGEEVYEFYARVHGLSAVIFRLGSVYGPQHKKGAVFAMMQSLKERGTIEISKQRVVRDFIYIDDVLLAIQRAVAYPKKGFHLFNITNGTGVELAGIARLICATAECGKVVRVDKKVYPAVVSASIEKAKKELMFAPRVALKAGLQATLTSYIV